MRYVLSLSLVLIALWLAISGVYKPPILLLGLASVGLVAWLSLRMEVVGVEHNPILYSWRLPIYWTWLVWQILLANFNVARLALNPASIRPQIIKVSVPQHSAVAKVTYANSCTLTPGTVALYLSDQQLTAHALDQKSADELRSGSMARKILWLENRSKREARP